MTPAQYIPLMRKLAEKDDLKQDKVDNVKTTDQEQKANMKDNKASLNSLFTKGKDSSVTKLFPGKTKKVTSDPFLKVAFARTMPKGRFPKTAAQVGVMFLAFQNELDKIANVPAIPSQAAPSALPSMKGFKSLVGNSGASGAGAGMAGGFGKALGGIGKAVSAVR